MDDRLDMEAEEVCYCTMSAHKGEPATSISK
jgi:hypothetical protein